MKPTFHFGRSIKHGIAVEPRKRPSVSVLKPFTRKPRLNFGKGQRGDGMTNHERMLANRK